MAKRPLLIVGTGGVGRQTHDIVAAINAVHPTWEVVGFTADQPPADLSRLARVGGNWLGPVDEVVTRSPLAFVVGIGNGHDKLRLADQFQAAGHELVSIIHPTAMFGSDVVIDPGTIALSYSAITTNIRIGRCTYFSMNVTVGHDVHIGQGTAVSAGANVSGNVTLGDRVWVGTGAQILQGLTIGDDVTIGAGAVVTKNVLEGATVAGIPARPQ